MKKCQPFGLVFAFMVLVTLCLAQEGGDEKKASFTTIDTHRSHEVVRPEDVKWGPASPKLPPGGAIRGVARGLVLSYRLRRRRARGRLKLNFLTVGLLLLRVYLRATDIVVLFVDWKCAKTLHFPA